MQGSKVSLGPIFFSSFFVGETICLVNIVYPHRQRHAYFNVYSSNKKGITEKKDKKPEVIEVEEKVGSWKIKTQNAINFFFRR